jgi:hypothetical protein
VDLFEELAEQAAARPGVSRNSRGSLVLEGAGVRAMTSKGAIVVKLDPALVRELVQAGSGRHYKDQPNAWLAIDPAASIETCRELITRALEKSPAADVESGPRSNV